jgi:hypothetical protein
MVMQKCELNTLTAQLEGTLSSCNTSIEEAGAVKKYFNYDKYHGLMLQCLVECLEEVGKDKVPFKKAIELFKTKVPDDETPPKLKCLAKRTMELALEGRCTFLRPVRGGLPVSCHMIRLTER